MGAIISYDAKVRSLFATGKFGPVDKSHRVGRDAGAVAYSTIREPSNLVDVGLDELISHVRLEEIAILEHGSGIRMDDGVGEMVEGR